MSSSNRVALRYIAEVTAGSTPANPAFQTIRRVGLPAFKYDAKTVVSDEVRSDRQISDNILVGKEASGEFDFELSYGAYDDFLSAVLYGTWTSAPTLYNLTSDSTITNVTNSTSTFTVASGGASFKAGHIVNLTGFTNSGNNGRARVTSSTGTAVVVSKTLTDESAPPAGARIRVVGFQGASGDINATSTGLSSTSLDFTTLGLAAGMFVKIGGDTSGCSFVTTANNGWARIASVAAHAITFDYFPSGWSSETGTSLTIQVWFGDYVRNGITETSFAFELSFEDHSPVTYQVFNGMVCNGLSLDIKPQDKMTGKFQFVGQSSVLSNTRTSGASTVAATTESVFNSSSNIAAVFVGGSIASIYVDNMTFDFNNNLNRVNAIGYDYSVDLSEGQFDSTGKFKAYFADKSLYAQMMANTESSFAMVVKDGSNHAYVIDNPRTKYSSNALSDSNNVVYQDLGIRALAHSTLGYTTHVQRFHYVE